MDNFALRCFNSLAQDREISGVQVASTLLRLPSYYTLHSKFVRVNLCGSGAMYAPFGLQKQALDLTPMLL